MRTDARLAQIKKPMGSRVLALYERSRAATTRPSARPCSTPSRRRPTTGRGRRSPPAATEQRADYVDRARSPTSVRRRSPISSPAVVPAALPADAEPVARRRRGAPAQPRGAQGAVVRGIARMDGRNDCHGRGDDRGPADASRRSGTTAAALPIVAKWDNGGRVRARSAERHGGRPAAPSSTIRQDERRSPRRARREPAGRSAAPGRSPDDDRADARRRSRVGRR